ncbi:hypothetical protein [Hymenobacter crusticola]|uniref:DUF5666 domain-containing protein n=1 Tax=Hymenobacter crusticola TaxID=1770526 RepID=A0A243WJ91_9BACT|nr:hypothetical protein [Hymenobacter crusticola]OUJ75340.1 hypothetical protein BXP70_04810 [Hymenobacter crusticola]
MLSFAVKPVFVASVALFLVGSPLAFAQQAPSASTPSTKAKVKTKAGKASPATPPPAPANGSALAPPTGGPQSGAPGGPPRPPRPGDGPEEPRGKARVQELHDFSGTLTEYVATNDDQVYDSFVFKTSAGTETVLFPRHLGQALLAVAKVGSQVSITGFRDTNPQGQPSLHLVGLSAGGQTVRDTPPVRPATPPAEETTTARGTVQRLGQDPRGRTNAVVLNDGTILRLPPTAAEQLANKLKVGATVAATGALRASVPGEVAAKPTRVVRTQTITLDGVQFLVQ